MCYLLPLSSCLSLELVLSNLWEHWGVTKLLLMLCTHFFCVLFWNPSMQRGIEQSCPLWIGGLDTRNKYLVLKLQTSRTQNIFCQMTFKNLPPQMSKTLQLSSFLLLSSAWSWKKKWVGKSNQLRTGLWLLLLPDLHWLQQVKWRGQRLLDSTFCLVDSDAPYAVVLKSQKYCKNYWHIMCSGPKKHGRGPGQSRALLGSRAKKLALLPTLADNFPSVLDVPTETY